MRTIKWVLGLLQIPRALLHILLLRLSPNRAVIEKDLGRWLQEAGYPELPEWRALAAVLWKYPAFRNVFYYRIAGEERVFSRVLLEFAKPFYRPMDTLHIYTRTIGPGLFIQHGVSTLIGARSIGRNCWINQGVSIGYLNETDTPTIGDNVRITAGAKVFGDITIGDNSVIGANAVVVKNVPPNCTVVGVPAYIVRCDGKKVKNPL